MKSSKKFNLVSPYSPAGDQAKVIKEICESIEEQNREQTILGVTGSGKTYIMASITNKLQRPTLVIAHNKTLAAQLAEEFSRFFPDNAVHYFVSYYDYYQPESYLPSSDTYIEKETQINEEIDRLRNAATQSLLSRRDVLIVASVSCIYGQGDPEDYEELSLKMQVGQSYKLDKIARRLIGMQFTRNQTSDLRRSQFRMQGEILEVVPASEEVGYRFTFFGDELESINTFDLLKRNVVDEGFASYSIFPANPYVTSKEKIKRAVPEIEYELAQRVKWFEKQNKFLEAQRISERVKNDLEMLQTVGFVSGVENYSMHLDGREDGETPTTLLDYFPDDFLCFIDESHITLSQIGAMYEGDRSRKNSLITYGFRLPSAFNNRPLRIQEFFEKMDQLVYVSATPGEFEKGASSEKYGIKAREIKVSEAIIRPTGLIDPKITVKPVKNQVDDVLEQVRKRVERGQRVLITTLTKKFAEELDVYFKQLNIKSAYIHSDVDTLERLDIISDLRRGYYDVLIGINLLREGLDLPEVGLIAIFDADKEGFLRSRTSLIQIVGRAARHEEGEVIMYADTITKSMKEAIDETERRRGLQMEYNQKHGITPKSTKRELKTISDKVREDAEKFDEVEVESAASLDDLDVAGKNARGGRFVDSKGKKVKNRVVFNAGKQVYADFEYQKGLEYDVLRQQKLSKPKLKQELEKAIEEMNFERAAAVRDLLG